jgi:hypothetical protein
MAGKKSRTVAMRCTTANPTQEQRILLLLHAAWPSWVPAISLSRISLQYGSRIFSLRKKGWRIANRTEINDGVRHGYFRLGERPIIGHQTTRAQCAQPADNLFGGSLEPDRSYQE